MLEYDFNSKLTYWIMFRIWLVEIHRVSTQQTVILVKKKLIDIELRRRKSMKKKKIY